MFIIGADNVTHRLLLEQTKCGDIYFVDCGDAYLNLTDKVAHIQNWFTLKLTFFKVLLGFKEAINNFDFKYILKIDTDTFVNVQGVINYVMFNGGPFFYAGLKRFFLILI